MSETTKTEASGSKTKKEISPTHSGMEDMVVAESSICFIDGIQSRLVYRGYSIDDLAHDSSFEEVVYLLLYKKLPTQSEFKAFSQSLAESRKLPEKFIEQLKSIPKTVHPMTVFRTLVSSLSFFDENSEAADVDSCLKKATRVIAQMPTIMAAWNRVRNGQTPIEPKKDLGHAANFLYMLGGKEPDLLFSKALDLYLILLADHELNASTFAARVTASTLSDYYSSITAAIGTLKGPLHGGANEQVVKMLFEIGDFSKVDAYVNNAFANKKKIMGFGHRVYKTKDPRSPILKDAAKEICQKTKNVNMFKILERIEELVVPVKKLPSNVDFYSSILLYSIGVPTDLFTPLFLMSRVSGYSAHFLEQISDNRLIRPRSDYRGQMDLSYLPIEKR